MQRVTSIACSGRRYLLHSWYQRLRLFLDESVGRRWGTSFCRLIGRLLFANLKAHLIRYDLLDLLRLLFDLSNVLSTLLGYITHVIGLVIRILGLDRLSSRRLTGKFSARLHGLDSALSRLIDGNAACSLWNACSVFEILLSIGGRRIEIYNLFVKDDDIGCSLQLLVYLSNLRTIRRGWQLVLHFFQSRNFYDLPSWHLILRVDDLRHVLTRRIPTHCKTSALTTRKHLLERWVRRRLLYLVIPCSLLISFVEFIRLPLGVRFRIYLEITVLLWIRGVFAHLRLVVFGIVIKEDTLVNAFVVGQQESLFSATRHLIQLLGDFLGHIFLSQVIIVIWVILVYVIATETLFLELLAILRVKLQLPCCKNFSLFFVRLVLV